MCSKAHSKRNKSLRGIKQTCEMFSWLALCESNWKRMQAAPKLISLITNHCFWITVQIWFTVLNLTLNKWVVTTFNSNQKGAWQEGRKASTNHLIPSQKPCRQLSFSSKNSRQAWGLQACICCVCRYLRGADVLQSTCFSKLRLKTLFR